MPVSHPTPLMGSTAATSLKTIFCCFAAITGTFVYAQRSSGPYAGVGAFGTYCVSAQSAGHADAPTFYRDVLPILRGHCEVCHRTAGIAPMSFESYEGAHPFAQAIHFATQNRSMPPWFAVTRIGRFSNDPSLSSDEIATLAAWAAAKAPAGNPDDAPVPHRWAQGWSIPQPDLIVKMTRPVQLPASGDVDYTYEIVSTHFAEGRWVQMAEVLPSSAGQCASCGGVHKAAGLELAAPCAGRRAVYRRGLEES